MTEENDVPEYREVAEQIRRLEKVFRQLFRNSCDGRWRDETIGALAELRKTALYLTMSDEAWAELCDEPN
jgi:hypothetical protein